MSRGLGWLQRYLFSTLLQSDEPLTFEEILQIAKPHEHAYQPHMPRSMRRALHKMVEDNAVWAIGAGGRADPHRYGINPGLKAMIERDREQKASH
jgi:hypothetical protein